MFSSSPALSGMNHSVYDVWVMDCLGKDPEAMPVTPDLTNDKALPDEGTVSEESVIKPDIAPEDQKQEVIPETKIEKILKPEKEKSEPEIEQKSAPQEENIEGIY
jgi:hypothetical protein